MTLNDFERFLTAEELVVALKEKGIVISARTLMDRARAGTIPSHKVIGRRKFRLSELLLQLNGGKAA